jgi:DnaJ-domain-containing protein 1
MSTARTKWVPGAKWLRELREWREKVAGTAREPEWLRESREEREKVAAARAKYRPLRWTGVSPLTASRGGRVIWTVTFSRESGDDKRSARFQRSGAGTAADPIVDYTHRFISAWFDGWAENKWKGWIRAHERFLCDDPTAPGFPWGDRRRDHWERVHFNELLLEADQAFADLGLQRTATKAEIRKAYRRLAKSAHPDAGGTAGRFNRLRHSYETAMQAGATDNSIGGKRRKT